MSTPFRAALDFEAINRLALASLPVILARWLPDGTTEAGEYVSRNPTRADHSPGSFKINLRSGKWQDFATGDRGTDAISLAAYLHRLEPYDAADRLAGMLGLKSGDRRNG